MRSVTEPRGIGTTLLYAIALLALVLATCGACAPGEAESRLADAGVPAGMVRIPGGSVRVGSDEGNADERPTFTAHVRPFLLDRHPVTVAQFRRFVEATGYVTEAERFGDAAVMDHAS